MYNTLGSSFGQIMIEQETSAPMTIDHQWHLLQLLLSQTLILEDTERTPILVSVTEKACTTASALPKLTFLEMTLAHQFETLNRQGAISYLWQAVFQRQLWQTFGQQEIYSSLHICWGQQPFLDALAFLEEPSSLTVSFIFHLAWKSNFQTIWWPLTIGSVFHL